MRLRAVATGLCLGASIVGATAVAYDAYLEPEPPRFCAPHAFLFDRKVDVEGRTYGLAPKSMKGVVTDPCNGADGDVVFSDCTIWNETKRRFEGRIRPLYADGTCGT